MVSYFERFPSDYPARFLANLESEFAERDHPVEGGTCTA